MDEARPGYKHTKLGWIPEEWEVARVGDACQVVNNLRAPLNVDERSGMVGTFPYYGPTGILGFINEFRIDGTYCLIGEDGDHFLDYSTKPQTILVTGKFNVNNHAHLVQGTEVCDTEWFYRFFYHRNIIPHITRQGAARYKLNKAALEELLIAYPSSLPEQRRIAQVLGAWDRAIATVQQLLAAQQERKRGLMQELLTGKRRFKGFGGKWKSHRLGDLFERVTRKNTVGEEHVLTISAQHGLIDQREIFNKSVAGANLAGYYLLKKSEFAYNKSSSNGYPVGAIKRLDRYEQGVLSTLYICFALKPGAANSDFIAAYFDAGMLDEGIGAIAQEGARNHGLLNVSTTDFFDIDVHIPGEAEQAAIAKVVQALNKETEAIQNQLEHLTTQKRGLMQQLLTGAVRVKV